MTVFKSYLCLLLLIVSSTVQSQAIDTEPLFVVHFETGPAWQADVAPDQQVGFDKHAKHLQHLRKNGRIPFGARYQQYGMVFLRAGSLNSATRILEADPGVKSGLFTYQIAEMLVFYPWQDNLEIK